MENYVNSLEILCIKISKNPRNDFLQLLIAVFWATLMYIVQCTYTYHAENRKKERWNEKILKAERQRIKKKRLSVFVVSTVHHIQ